MKSTSFCVCIENYEIYKFHILLVTFVHLAKFPDFLSKVLWNFRRKFINIRKFVILGDELLFVSILDRHTLSRGLGIWGAAESFHESCKVHVRAELHFGGGGRAEMGERLRKLLLARALQFEEVLEVVHWTGCAAALLLCALRAAHFRRVRFRRCFCLRIPLAGDQKSAAAVCGS